MGFVPTWLRQVSPRPLLHMTILATACRNYSHAPELYSHCIHLHSRCWSNRSPGQTFSSVISDFQHLLAPSVWNSLPQTILISDSLYVSKSIDLFFSETSSQPLKVTTVWRCINSIIMPRPLGGGFKRWCCLTSVYLTSVCLSVEYIGNNSRTERPTKTKIGA